MIVDASQGPLGFQDDKWLLSSLMPPYIELHQADTFQLLGSNSQNSSSAEETRKETLQMQKVFESILKSASHRTRQVNILRTGFVTTS